MWKKIYSGKRMTRWEAPNGNTLELYPEQIHKIRVWFVAVTSKTKIADKEFSTKKEASEFAKKYMSKHPYGD